MPHDPVWYQVKDAASIHGMCLSIWYRLVTEGHHDLAANLIDTAIMLSMFTLVYEYDQSEWTDDERKTYDLLASALTRHIGEAHDVLVGNVEQTEITDILKMNKRRNGESPWRNPRD